MCLIIFGLNEHPEYELVLLANRDEFFERKTTGAHYWKSPDILAGKDEQAGGTWLGLDKKGRLAAVTNYRDPKSIKNPAPSRGHIPVLFLEGKVSAGVFLKTLSKEAHRYNGFNLLLKDGSGMFHYSNVSNKTTQLSTGVYGLSNALLDSPWPKVEMGKERLKKALALNKIEDRYLASLLKDENIAEDDHLPHTGVPIEVERQLSAMFIKIPGYGTRCTTLVKIKKDHSASFTEIVYNNAGNPVETNRFVIGNH